MRRFFTGKPSTTNISENVVATMRLLNLSKDGRPIIQTYDDQFTSNFEHETELVQNVDKSIISEEFHALDGTKTTFQCVWFISKLYTVVTHGHGFEILFSGVKIADMHFNANVALRTRVEPCSPEEISSEALSIEDERFSRLIVSASGQSVQIKSEINTKEFKYTNRQLVGGSEHWKTYSSAVNLNYLLETTNDPTGSKFLLIGFSAIREIGDFTYNYKASLAGINANKLFILDDFGDQGAYYYSDHENLNIFTSVQCLISDVVETLGVSRSNTIALGSSKGGAAALIHGISADLGHVYVGAPQVKIGSFVAKPHPNILELTMGDKTPTSIEKLDSVIFNIVDNATSLPKTTIAVGNSDHHYKNHALPLAEFAASQGQSIKLIVLNGVPHAEIGYKYRELVAGYISRVIANN